MKFSTINIFNNSHWIDFVVSEEIAGPTYKTSSRGYRQLIHNGYTYTKKAVSAKKILWRCTRSENSRYICLAKATTYEKNGIERASFSGTHGHSPNITIWFSYLRSMLSMIAY